MFRVITRAALICAGASLAAAVLSLGGVWWLALFTSVGFGFLGMSVGEGWLHPRHGSSTLAAFAGLFIVAAAGFISLAQVEQRLWPYHKSGYTLEQAHDNVLASSFTFSGAQVKADLRGEAAVLGRYNSTVDRVTVVPLVDESAKLDEPILVWAVSRRADLAERSRLWHQSIGIGVRVGGFYSSAYEEAAKDACRRHELHVGRDPLFIEWTPSPTASLVAAWRALGTIVLIAALSLVVVVVVVKIIQPSHKRSH
jgi:hypothetical protein